MREQLKVRGDHRPAVLDRTGGTLSIKEESSVTGCLVRNVSMRGFVKDDHVIGLGMKEGEYQTGFWVQDNLITATVSLILCLSIKLLLAAPSPGHLINKHDFKSYDTSTWPSLLVI